MPSYIAECYNIVRVRGNQAQDAGARGSVQKGRADDMTLRFCGVLILVAGAGVFYVSGLLIATGDPARWLWTATAVFGAAMAGIGVKLLAETRRV